MRLIALHIFKWAEQSPVLLCSEMELSMLWFYQKDMAKQHCNFNARMIAERIPPGNKASVALENNAATCYCWTTKDGLSATAITDNEYPERASFILLNTLIMDFRECFPDSSVFDGITNDNQVRYENLPIFLRKW
mgnify:CR=1 FL=1